MKFLRKNPLNPATFVVFIGYLLSSSIITYQALPVTHLTMLSPYIWLLLATLILISYIYGFSQYLHTSHCSFILQIAEYIMVPIASFTLIQQISLKKIQNNKNILTTWILVYQILIFVCILVLTVIKINFINQVFPNQHHKQILLFSKLSRFLRVSKICANCFGLLFLTEGQHLILISLFNTLEFLVINTKITFINIQIERVLLLANLNNIFSIGFHFLHPQKHGLIAIMPQVVLTLFYLLTVHPMQSIIQFKYLLQFRKLEPNENNFHDGKTKPILILLFACFTQLYNFEHESKLIQKQQAKFQYSPTFIYELKKTYKTAILFYLSNICTVDDRILLSNVKIGTRTNIKKSMQQNVKLKFEQFYKKHLSINQIIENKILFLDFIAFCMDKLHQLINMKQFPWNESTQFFLTFTVDLNANFIMKKLKFHHLGLKMIDQQLFYRTRHQKTYNYLKTYKKYYQMNKCKQQDYIMFEKSLEDLKTKMIEIAHMEEKLIEKINNPMIKVYQYEQNLVQKEKKKEQIKIMFQNCFENPHYPHFDEFIFLFLIFFIIYCKFVTKSISKVKQKFVHIKKGHKFEELEIMNKPILVCYGWQNPSNKVGDIMLSNVTFRKNFGFSSMKNNYINRTINQLISNNQQSLKHMYLMNQSGKFSLNREKTHKHSDHQCLLKVNLQSGKFNLLKYFTVSTHAILSYDQTLLYACILEEKDIDIYMEEQQYDSFLNKDSDDLMDISIKQPLWHTQLNLQMRLVRVSENDLREIGIKPHHTKYKSQYADTTTAKEGYEEQNNLRHRFLSQEDHKFSKIESVLWKKDLKFEKKLFFHLFISLFALTAGLGCCVGVSYFSQSRSNSAIDIATQFAGLMTSTQGCQMRMSYYLYLISQMQMGKLNKDVCTSVNISDFNTYLRTKSTVCIKSRINGYFIKYYNSELKIMPVFDPNFISNIGIKSQVPYDYSNYIWQVGTRAVKFLQMNFSLIDSNQKSQLNTYIDDHNSVDNKSISHGLIGNISKQILFLLENIQFEFHSLVSLAYFVITIFFIVFIIFSFLMFLQYMRYPQLLSKISRTYFIQRLQEMNFMKKQINKTYDYNLKKITFIKDDQVRIQQNTFNNAKQFEVGISQLDKLAKIQENKEAIELNDKNVSLLRNVLESNKYLLSAAIISCLILMIMASILGKVNSQIIKSTFYMRQVITEGAIAKQTLLQLNFILWMAYNKQTQITNKTQNYRSLITAYENLKNDKFFLLLYNNLGTDILDQIVYVKICEMIQKYYPDVSRYSVCMHQLGQMSQYTTDQLLSIITKQHYDAWNVIYGNQQNQSAEKLCRSTLAILDYVINAQIATMKSIQYVLNVDRYQLFKKTQIYLYLVVVVSFIYVTIFYLKAYFRLTYIIKFEVLTMDSPKNLYEHPEFKPYLNCLYYKHLA